MATRTKPGRRDADDRYLTLVRAFPLRPLRSDAELGRAVAVINALLDRDDLDPGEEDYLDVLGDLVRKYEVEHHPIPPAPDAEVLRFLIASNATTQAAVSAATGIAESTISEVLAGRRGLNRRHVAALSRHFHVSPAAFLAE
jgi:HTH-type transcriptional regulator/antitoxin HigA